jgi:hypothetical protein
MHSTACRDGKGGDTSGRDLSTGEASDRRGPPRAVASEPARRRTVEIHRPGKRLETLVNPVTVALDPELPGFELELAPIFDLR